jgi:demethoxyubiquinone hydroxylase (CLK1/Coq7/Cat5 family)
MSAIDLQKKTTSIIRDLHARESMRLGWYRQWGMQPDKMAYLRERKARHEAFLEDLLRKRGISPAWYARLFYLAGHAFGLVSALFPERFMNKIERRLEFWILLRYQAYFRQLKLDRNLRSMIESLQMKRMTHNEPAPDVMELLERIIHEEELSMSR